MKKLLTLVFLFGMILNSAAQDTTIVYQQNGMIRIDDLYEESMFLTPGQVSVRFRGGDIYLKDGLNKNDYNLGSYDEIFNIDTIGFDNEIEVVEYLTMIINRAVSDVFISDQTTLPIDFFFLQANAAPTTLTQATAINDLTINVTSAAAFSIGDYVGVFSGESGEARFYFGEVLSVNVNEITLDTPLDYAFDIGDNVISTTRELNVDGGTTSQSFIVQGGAEGSPISIDITRIIFKIITTDPPEFSDFGDIANGLANGIVLRRNNGYVSNIFNAKTNGELANLMYDITFYEQDKVQGVNGISGRMTFAGQAKHGVAIRLTEGETLEMIIQDDLTSLISFRIIAQGHIVED